MNFMATRQSGGGFYEDDSSIGTRPFSICSSSPSSSHQHQQQQQHRGRLVPLSYPHHHHHHHHQPRGPWDETAASFRGYSGGGASQLDLVMIDSSSSPTSKNHHHLNNINNVDDADVSDEHLAVRRGVVLDSASGGGGGGGTTSTSTASAAMMTEREHMFDKVVTPSDVGKLNRLVIPKQHAEKYFPLDSSSNEKGLLLNFEDRNGKPWRFRYSYWNSSQSYVMTKGWSRFVKEKKLDAGDVVSFQRGIGELGKDRLFIDWRRRPDAPDHHHHLLPPSMSSFSLPHPFSWNQHPFYLQQQQQQHHYHQTPRDHSQLLQVNATSTNIINNNVYANVMAGNPCSGPIIYLRSAASARPPQHLGFGLGTVQLQKGGSAGLNPRGTEEEEPVVFESVPVVQGKAAAKRLRLFGVNMDCPISESSEEDDCGIVLPPTGVPHSTIPSQFARFSSSSSSSVSPLQLRPYNYGSVLLQTMPSQSHLLNNNSNNKGKASMSLDLDI